MHTHKKTDFESLYHKLFQKFPDLKRNDVWEKWEWSNQSCEQSVVISEVSREMIKWAEEENWQQVEDLLDEIESAFINGAESVISYLGTDFTVTVMECKNPAIRKRIKQLMGHITFKAYQMNLRGYSEE